MGRISAQLVSEFDYLVSGAGAAGCTLAASAPCQKAGVGREVQPGENDLGAHLRRYANTAYHPVGTCRLGRSGDAVVDAHLRVIGVSGLRVVDASVMPTTVAGNAQAAVIAIAERAADLVRNG